MASPLERASPLTALGWGYAKPTCTRHSDHHLEKCPTVRQKQGLGVSGFGTDGVEFLARDSENVSNLATNSRQNEHRMEHEGLKHLSARTIQESKIS